MIKNILSGARVDEGWYRTNYPDVDEAIKRGIYKSGMHHFIEDSYFEGRKPFPAD